MKEFQKGLHTIQVVGREVRSEFAADLAILNTAVTEIEIHHWQVTDGAEGFWYSRKFRNAKEATNWARGAIWRAHSARIIGERRK